MEGFSVVLDVGKTHSKASLWTPAGEQVVVRQHANQPVVGPGYRALDARGIEAFLEDALREFAGLGPVRALIPVAHGAAIAVLREGQLALPPMDYEQELPPDLLAGYRLERDAFGITGSPALPQGLNLGAQLHLLEKLHPAILDAATTLVTWPQYWAWLLCGVAATEVSSLGCHTDLWQPLSGAPSPRAVRRGWAARFAPLRHASACLGTLGPAWAARTGLDAAVKVHCGLHDSNAALLAARTQLLQGRREATVLSTGTWFIALRSGADVVDAGPLDEHRDCLMNVDVDGRPVPSARFMGGRELEVLTRSSPRAVDAPEDQAQMLAAVPDVVRAGTRVLPTFASGCGPFATSAGRWVNEPKADIAVRAAAALYAALVADASLQLIGTREMLLVEGRFAACEVFVRALARLRPELSVHTSTRSGGVSRGALSLLVPALHESASSAASPAQPALRQIVPLDYDLAPLRDSWRAAIKATEQTT